MSEAERLQTLETILPRLVGDDRVRFALAQRFGSRTDDLQRCVERGEHLPEEDRKSLIEEVGGVLDEHGEVEAILPPEAGEDEFTARRT